MNVSLHHNAAVIDRLHLLVYVWSAFRASKQRVILIEPVDEAVLSTVDNWNFSSLLDNLLLIFSKLIFINSDQLRPIAFLLRVYWGY